MKRYITAAVMAAICAAAASCTPGSQVNTLRAPAYPLVTIDPYTSAWSAADHLNDVPVTHWTGREFPFDGLITVDGTEYRFMGAVTGYRPLAGNVLTGDWESEDMHLERTFTLDSVPEGTLYYRYANRRPARFYLNGELFLDARHKRPGKFIPLTDAQKALLKPGANVLSATSHNTRKERLLDIELFCATAGGDSCAKAVQTLADVQATNTGYAFECGPVRLELRFTAPLLLEDLDLVSRPVNYVTYAVTSTDGARHDVSVKFAADAKGWCVNTPDQEVMTETVSVEGLNAVRGGSVEQAILGRTGDDVRIDWGYLYLASATAHAEADGSRLRLSEDFGSVDKAGGHFLIAYDDIFSVHYFGEDLRPYWNRKGDRSILDVIRQAEEEYGPLMDRCAAFDREMFAEAERKGGRKYAELCALAYRQAITAHKLVELPNGEPGLFSKENNSNGSIGTVDVTYPSAPIFLKYNPDLCAALLNHIFDYSESGRWTKPFPAHDVGTYPVATGQTYPHDMPVEEGGNMLILTAATCHAKGAWDYAARHWDTLSTWEGYLEKFGLDPEDQLCTDDFAGKMAHNANLSIKAILGIASFAMMAGNTGHGDIAEEKMALARELAAKWVEMDAAGDHYGLTFDRKDSWSQKYNLVWDKLLGLDVFPEGIIRTELDWYPSVMGRYGLPLDNRSTYTKSDWIMWTASMADSKEEFESFIAPVWDFYDSTVERVPMSDWFYTDSPTYCEFIARSVVGGYFIKML